MRATRARRGWLIAALGAGVLALGIPAKVRAQTIAPFCDFDIADNLGRDTYGNTVHLTGRNGASTIRGSFYLINSLNASSDVDLDGFNPDSTTCTYRQLFVPDNLKRNLVNVDNPSLAIPSTNIIVANMPRTLAPGDRAEVNVFVEIPLGTPAGRYIGGLEVRDNAIVPTLSTTGDELSLDFIQVEVIVVGETSFAIVNPDSAVPLDSVVLAGRASQRVSGVFRIANTGNVNLADVQISATDLVAESSVGITIPSGLISFSPPSFSSGAQDDTARVTVAVSIPRGILGGRYRGSILVQAAGASPVRIPLILIVTSSRGLVFENNPVRNNLGGVARIAFDGDPGTEFQVAIFDMNGMLVFTNKGTVFAGVTPGGQPGTSTAPAPGADFAVSITWPLVNGAGDGVASGVYLVVINSIVAGQGQVAQAKLMVIR
jgi:hypothetical protein